MKKPEIITIALLAIVLAFSLALLLKPELNKEPAIGNPAPETINTNPSAKSEADKELDLRSENGQ